MTKAGKKQKKIIQTINMTIREVKLSTVRKSQRITLRNGGKDEQNRKDKKRQKNRYADRKTERLAGIP